MPKAWTRNVSINNTALVNKGYVSMATLLTGYSLLHTFWSIELWGTWGSINQYPPGSSVVRAGLIAADLLTTPPPYPITNESADWIDLVTLHPVGQIATSTNVDWQYNWSTGTTDRDSRVHRKNTGAPSLGLWITYEIMVAADALAGFDVNGWSATCDAYISH